MAVNGAKPSVSEEAVRYQARTTLAVLATELADLRKHKSTEGIKKLKELKQIRLFLKALDYKAYLTRLQRERIWYALIDIANINDFPVSPLLEERTQPNILIGGGTTTNNTIIQSESAGNISFVNSDVDTGTEVVDSFPISLSSGAKWKYTARKNDGSAQKSGEIIGTWLADGSDVDWAEAPITSDVGASPSDVTIAVAYNSGDIELQVTVSTDNWTIEGSREHIPPINNNEVNINLPDAQIYVGSAIGIATARTVSGDITISNTGVVTIGSIPDSVFQTVLNNNDTYFFDTFLVNNVDELVTIINDNSSTQIIYTNLDLTDSIVNADVNSSAGIVYSKLSLTGGIVNADINSSAAIAQSKIANLTADLAAKLSLSGGTMTGVIAMGSNKITGLATGTASGDAVNKGQMDTAIAAAAAYDPGTWTSMTLINSWSNDPAVGPCAYRRDSNGTVFLKGSCTNSGDVSSACFNLPAGYRPLASMYLWGNAVKNDTTSHSRITVSSGGNIAPSSAQRLYLDNISFTTSV